MVRDDKRSEDQSKSKKDIGQRVNQGQTRSENYVREEQRSHRSSEVCHSRTDLSQRTRSENRWFSKTSSGQKKVLNTLMSSQSLLSSDHDNEHWSTGGRRYEQEGPSLLAAYSPVKEKKKENPPTLPRCFYQQLYQTKFLTFKQLCFLDQDDLFSSTGQVLKFKPINMLFSS